MNNFYYVLYKIDNSEYLWIVRASDDYFEIVNMFNECKCDNEYYYLIKTKVKDVNDSLNFKNFTTYTKQNNDIIIMQSL
jgi:hypothetical protein